VIHHDSASLHEHQTALYLDGEVLLLDYFYFYVSVYLGYHQDSFLLEISPCV
jgi:hypothetical protein